MKYPLTTLLILLCSCAGFSQTETLLNKGKVSYLSSTNVYVKFESTLGIEIGDTLFAQQGNQFFPSVVVANKSSSSCVGIPVPPQKAAIGEELVHRRIGKAEMPEPEPEPAEETPEAADSKLPAKESLRSERPVAARAHLLHRPRRQAEVDRLAALVPELSAHRQDHRRGQTGGR